MLACCLCVVGVYKKNIIEVSDLSIQRLDYFMLGLGSDWYSMYVLSVYSCKRDCGNVRRACLGHRQNLGNVLAS